MSAADAAAARLAADMTRIVAQSNGEAQVLTDDIDAVLKDRIELAEHNARLAAELTELKAALVELKPLRHASDDPVEIYRKGRLDGAADKAAELVQAIYYRDIARTELDRLKGRIAALVRVAEYQQASSFSRTHDGRPFPVDVPLSSVKALLGGSE